MRRFRTKGFLPCLVSVSMLAACGGSGGGGDGGAAGSGGEGGAAGSAGEGGAAGSAGEGGSAGSGGVAGSGGASACTPMVPPTTLQDGIVKGLHAAQLDILPPVVTPQPGKTPPEEHFAKQIGVLHLSPQEGDLRAITHLLEPVGAPYAITTSPALAFLHDMALFFPEAYPENFDVNQLLFMDDYVASGGLIVAKYSEVPLLQELGGVIGSVFQVEHHEVLLTAAGLARFPSLDRPEEQVIPLGGDAVDYLNTWTLSVNPSATGVSILATFEDGTPAIVERTVESGRVVTMGVDFRDLIIRNHLGYALDGAARGFINVFEPATDVWSLMMRDLYDSNVRFGTRLATAPDAKRGALLLTHDLDWGKSYENAVVYAQDEKAAGASATYFSHTKYITDVQDMAFFDEDAVAFLADVHALGGQVASHTVAHSRVLDLFDLGSGTEAYPSYLPKNISDTQTEGGTLIGELMVSKELLDGALEVQCIDARVRAFRAGNLAYHPESPHLLERLGYRYDSTQAIGVVLGNFPFRLMTTGPDPLDTSVWEFPVTIEDMIAPKLDMRVAQALDIVAANADNGAPTNLLIHPNVLDFKRNAQKELLAALPADVLATSVEEYGDFWAARAAAKVTSVEYDDLRGTLTLVVRAGAPVSGLTVRVDPVVTGVVSPAGLPIKYRGTDALVVLPPLSTDEQLTVVLSYPPP